MDANAWTDDLALGADNAATLLQVPEWRFWEIAEAEGLLSHRDARWDLAQLTRVALRLLIIGSPDEQESARRALDVLREARSRGLLGEVRSRGLDPAARRTRPTPGAS